MVMGIVELIDFPVADDNGSSDNGPPATILRRPAPGFTPPRLIDDYMVGRGFGQSGSLRCKGFIDFPGG